MFRGCGNIHNCIQMNFTKLLFTEKVYNVGKKTLLYFMEDKIEYRIGWIAFL